MGLSWIGVSVDALFVRVYGTLFLLLHLITLNRSAFLRKLTLKEKERSIYVRH